jgi:hypothetical protein
MTTLVNLCFNLKWQIQIINQLFSYASCNYKSQATFWSSSYIKTFNWQLQQILKNMQEDTFFIKKPYLISEKISETTGYKTTTLLTKEADRIFGLTHREWRVNNLQFMRMNIHCLANTPLHTAIVLCHQYSECTAATWAYRSGRSYTVILGQTTGLVANT